MECHPIVENENEAICQEYVRSAIGLKPGCVLGPREQMNFATAFLDGSGIYGSTPKSSEDLRLLKGTFNSYVYKYLTRIHEEFLYILFQTQLSYFFVRREATNGYK